MVVPSFFNIMLVTIDHESTLINAQPDSTLMDIILSWTATNAGVSSRSESTSDFKINIINTITWGTENNTY